MEMPSEMVMVLKMTPCRRPLSRPGLARQLVDVHVAGRDHAPGGGDADLSVQGAFELGGVPYLNGGIGFEKARGDVREILHVRPKDDGATGGGGFDGVLSADAVETFSDEDHVGVGVEEAEFPSAVDQEALGAAGFRFGGKIDLAAVDVSHAAAAELAADGAGAFEVSGNEHEVQVGMLFAEPGEDVSEGGLFTFMRASSEQDPGVVGHAGLTEQFRHIQRAGVAGNAGFELEAADRVNGIGAATELDQTIPVALALSADGFEPLEQVAEQEACPPVAREGSIGNSGIGEDDGDASAPRLPEHVGPEFGLDEDQDLGVENPESAPDPGASVDGKIHLLDDERQLASEFRHPGGGGGGNDELDGGQSGFEGADEQGGQVDLADADGMDPNDAPVGERLFDPGGIGAETFTEPFPPTSSAPKPEEIVRE
jgi:hypothetical protein